MSERVAVYGGSFDPPTLAHEDVVRAGLEIFDRVDIFITSDTTKSASFDESERVEIWEEIREQRGWGKRCEVHRLPVDALFAPYVVETFGRRFILRGLCSGLDLEYELNLAANNTVLAPGVQTVIIPVRKEYDHISSTIVREVMAKSNWMFNLSNYVSAPVITMVRRKGHRVPASA